MGPIKRLPGTQYLEMNDQRWREVYEEPHQ